MDWQDDGILLTTRPHGESSAIIEVLTAGHGRHLALRDQK
jgi:DNA repair protein RecO (recombination protein O)